LSDGFQHTQNGCGAAKEVEPAVVGGEDLLIGCASSEGWHVQQAKLLLLLYGARLRIGEALALT
jgi:hypothetical protein